MEYVTGDRFTLQFFFGQHMKDTLCFFEIKSKSLAAIYGLLKDLS